MSRGLTAEELSILASSGITTAICARLDFKSEPVCVWTGVHDMRVEGSADSLLNNQNFMTLQHGVVLSIGENNFTMQGSDALDVTLAIPAAASTAINAAMYFPAEYQGRRATLWRVLIVASQTPGQKPQLLFRRLRTGTMDYLTVTNDGQRNMFAVRIESHAGLMSAASGSTYLDQKKFDPTDTSQDYAVAIANGTPAPTKPALTGWDRLGAQMMEDAEVWDRFRSN